MFLLFIFVLSGIQSNIWVIKTLPGSNILPCYRILQCIKTFADSVLFYFNYPGDVNSLCSILESTYHFMALISIQISMSAIIFLFTNQHSAWSVHLPTALIYLTLWQILYSSYHKIFFCKIILKCILLIKLWIYKKYTKYKNISAQRNTGKIHTCNRKEFE